MTPLQGHDSLDARSLDALRNQAAKNPQGATRQAAVQFESLFMQMVIKSMRDATPKAEGASAGQETFTGMLDSQFAKQFSGRPGGLADVLERQLSPMRNLAGTPGLAAIAAPLDGAAAGTGTATAADSPLPHEFDGGPNATAPQPPLAWNGGQAAAFAPLALNPATMPAAGLPFAGARAAGPSTPRAAPAAQPQRPAAPALQPVAYAPRRQPEAVKAALAATAPAAPPAASAAGASDAARTGAAGRAEFLARMMPHARAAERQTGVPASFILGQAALESGWGKAEIRKPDGSNTFNLFGIKATRGWTGGTADARTTEFEGGQAVKQTARFRSYGSYTEAFADYARMLAGSSRYSQVVRNATSAESFAGGMQRAGYATDPQYASKLAASINHALALQRAMG